MRINTYRMLTVCVRMRAFKLGTHTDASMCSVPGAVSVMEEFH